MKIAKEYGISLLNFLGFLLGGSVIISVFYYFLFSSKVVNVLGFLYLLGVFFFFGMSMGKKASAKGFVAGLKIGLIQIMVLLIINLLFYQSGFQFVRLFYYLLLLFISVLGAMIGINTKKNE